MGKQAVISHSKGEKHKSRIAACASILSPSISSHFTVIERRSASNLGTAGPSTSQVITTAEVDSVSHIDPLFDITDTTNVTTMSESPVLNKQPTQQSVIAVNSPSVSRAEIIFALDCVAKHSSYNSHTNFVKVLNLALPDSEIAKKMTLGPDKLSYLIAFGLGPHFKNQLLEKLQKVPFFVACFDEAFNKIIKKGQLDVHVKFWDSDLQRVECRYINSVFMGHATASDIFDSFNEALAGFDMKKLLQISMDGPNVNWKFVDDFKEANYVEADDPRLLEIGSCGLHVMHGAFQTGHKKSGWNINSMLHSMYYLFKDSPARSADFTRITGSVLFPKKYCGHRWLENSEVVETGLVLLPKLKLYVEKIEKKPIVSSFATLERGLQDKFLVPKLEFFKCIISSLEPFMRRFQAKKPMIPFMYAEIYEVLKILLAYYIKPDVLSSAHTSKCLLDIATRTNRNDTDMKLIKNVDIGIGATKSLPKKCTEIELMAFKEQCRIFVMETCKKIGERCPLKYKLIRGVSALSPVVILASSDEAKKRFQTCLLVLAENNRISSTVADRAKLEYSRVTENVDFINCMKLFNSEHDRIDVFWHSLLDKTEGYKTVLKVIQTLLLLSHGNACVESGFSVNEDMLVENLKERSLISQRIVYDAVNAAGGVTKMDFDNDKKLLLSTKGARSRYESALQEAKKESRSVEMQESLKRKQSIQRKVLEQKKQRLNEEHAAAVSVLDSQISSLK